eukprot:jgi/Mesen1/9582/ME000656S08856
MEVVDRQSVRKAVWAGAIPLRVTLAPNEVTTLQAPHPIYIMGHRNGYLPLLVGKLKPHFQEALPPGVDTVWFEYRGLPLKWYIPIGVLYDILTDGDKRPWPLTVHFRAYPSDLLSWEDENTVRELHLNSLKQAVHIMHGSTKLVTGLSQLDLAELWASAASGNGESYERIASRLRPDQTLPSASRGAAESSATPPPPLPQSPGSRQVAGSRRASSDGAGTPSSPGTSGQWGGSHARGRAMRIPLRLYLRDVTKGGGAEAGAEEDGVPTVGDALRATVPFLFPASPAPALHLVDPPPISSPLAMAECRKPSVGDIDSALAGAASNAEVAESAQIAESAKSAEASKSGKMLSPRRGGDRASFSPEMIKAGEEKEEKEEEPKEEALSPSGAGAGGLEGGLPDGAVVVQPADKDLAAALAAALVVEEEEAREGEAEQEERSQKEEQKLEPEQEQEQERELGEGGLEAEGKGLGGLRDDAHARQPAVEEGAPVRPTTAMDGTGIDVGACNSGSDADVAIHARTVGTKGSVVNGADGGDESFSERPAALRIERVIYRDIRSAGEWS